MTVNETNTSNLKGHEDEGEEVYHEPQLFPPFLALTSILVALAVNFIGVDADQNLFGVITLPKETAVAMGFGLAILYAIFLMLFFLKEALNKKIIPTISHVVFSNNLVMWIFIASEIVFFGVLIGLSLIMRINNQYIAGLPWINANLPANADQTYFQILTGPMSLFLTVFITYILLLSSYTMMKAVQAMERSDRIGMRNWLFLTALGGAFFALMKIFEYYSLTNEGVYISTNLFWTTFFLTTGFHTLHVIVGVMLITFFCVKAGFVKGKTAFNKENGRPIEYVALYWHYVDIVWIFLMPIMYFLT